METALSALPNSSSSSSSSTDRWEYDVFISFRGEDTRNTFADLLYDAFKREGINAFKDDEKLEKGKTISQELSNAIEKSRYAVVIFSKNYASSIWCLNEVVKIVQCKKEKIWPVFYDVEPSDVRKQKGTFEQDFIEHEQNFNEHQVEMWRVALSQVGEIVGWHVTNRPLSQVIRSIVRVISGKLNYHTFSDIDEGLVGLDSRVLELESCLDVGSDDVRFIGIWAMGGMGKTTLAKVVYRMFFKEFEACSFIADVRELSEKYGLVFLQQKLVSDILMETDLKVKDTDDGVLVIKKRCHNKKILLVLDDIHELDQLNNLARKNNWFGPGSRIIITTRDEHVLKKHEVDQIYEVKGLNGQHALHLFCLNAFKREYVPADYFKLSKDFLNYAGGLPLALRVLGSVLFGKSTVAWKSAVERYKNFPDENIVKVLQISFDGLHYLEKEIFLYIACIFNREKKDDIVQMLDILGLHPDIGFEKLIDKSLLKIMDEDIVWMHDILVKMGRNIVFRECPNDPENRSRLCHYEDIDKVLKRNKGTGAIQAINISGICQAEKEARWNLDAFSKMGNLKFLRIRNVRLQHGPKHLPNDLRILDWHSYPSKSLPPNFQADELVQLCLQMGNIEQLSIGIKKFEKLKFIDLSSSYHMIITPDFTGVPNLEKLVLKYCENLCELHPSIGLLKNLVLLSLSFCSNLSCLPSTLVGNMKSLQKLDLDHTAIMELPSSVEVLIGLTSLSLNYCKNIVCLPSTICSLKLLECLDLSGCSNFDNLPKNIGNVKSLKKLGLSGTAIKELPSSIERLKSLTSLTLLGCHKLVCLPNTSSGFKFHGALNLSRFSNFKNLPENPWIISSIKMLDLSRTAIEELPSSIECLTSLTLLTIKNCKNFVCLPSTICSLKLLESLDLSGCSKFDNLPKNLGNVESLKKLDLSRTAIKELPSSIERLASLTSLTILCCYELECLPNTTCGLKLCGALDLSSCFGLKKLSENLWLIEGLDMLDLSKTSIEEIPSSIEYLTNLTALTLRYCMNLVRLPSTICSLKLLNSLDLFGCLKFDNLPENIGNMKGLELLNLCWTAIKEVPSSIFLLKSLKQLHIRGWKLSEFYTHPASLESMGPLWISLFFLPTSPATEIILLPSFLYNSLARSAVQTGLLLPCLSSLHSLTYFHLSDCNLSSIPNDIGCLFSLECLNLSGNNFVSLPESMSQLCNLQRLNLEGCKRLQSLENIPSTIISVIANDCISLEKLPELQFYPFKSDHSHLNFQCFNCSKLIGYIQSSSNMLQGLPDIIIPGGEIPEWFSHKYQDYNIQMSFCECDKLMGIALCVVFVPNGSHQYLRDWRLSCSFHVNGFEIAYFLQSYYFTTKYGKFESPHLWLLYLSSHHFVSNSSEIFSSIDGNGFSQLNIKTFAEGVDVKKIGVHLVYKQGIEDPNQTMAQGINSNRIPYENLDVIHHDIDDSAIESSRNKQSRDVDDGAGPSVERYSHEEPQPKWIHRVGEFMADSEDSSQREILDFFAREDEISKKLESIHGGKSDSYQDIEDPTETITQLCINSRTLYEDLGDRHHDLYNSAAEGCRNKLSHDEEDGAGPSGEGYSHEEPQPKWIHRVGEFMADSEDSSQMEILDFFAREDEMSKKLESIHGGKSDSYQDIEDPTETITQLCINSRTLYEGLGDRHHDLYNSAAEGSRNKLSHDEEDGAGPSGEGYSNKEPKLKWIHRVREFMDDYEDSSQMENFDFFAREDQTSKKLESIHGGKRDSYQDIEDPNQTITQLSINSRTLYEDLGDRHHDLYDSTLEGSRNKRSRDEDGRAGPSGEGYSSDEPHSKTWRMYD